MRPLRICCWAEKYGKEKDTSQREVSFLFSAEYEGRVSGRCPRRREPQRRDRRGRDDGADKIDLDVSDLIPETGDQIVHIFDAVAVADKDGLVFQLYASLNHHLCQMLEALLSAADLFHKDQAALIIHMEDGLDVQRCAQGSRDGGDAAPFSQVMEVIYCEPVARCSRVFSTQAFSSSMLRPFRFSWTAR